MKQKTRSPISRKTKIATSIVLVFLVLQIIVPILFSPKPAQAFIVHDPIKLVWDATKKVWDWVKKHGAAIAFKNAVKTFTTKIAYDTAVWIGSGGKGQQPLFYTKGWGAYLRDTADSAAGEFMTTILKENFGMNLCEPPDLSSKLKIQLGLGQEIQPKKPACKWSKMRKNWEEAIEDPNFLRNFSSAFDPMENDIGVYLSLATNLMEKKTESKASATLDREGKWAKDVVSPISNNIETPADMTQEQVNQAIKNSTKPEETFTGDIWADTISVFTNTLVANLMKRMKKGFWSVADLVDEDALNSGLTPGGKKAAKAAFASLGVVNIKVGGEYDVVSQFSSCPSDSKYAATDNCVIDSKLANLLNGGDLKTIKEAIDAGDLHGNWLVAEKGLKDQPSDYLSRYSLTNIKKLRKALIIPLGLEIAAQKINSGEVDGNYTLNDIVNGFDDSTSPFYRLVDTEWILKTSLMYCRAKVYGPIPESGSNYRQETCVDEQHCISENDDKSCNAWGYCTKEKNIWRFNGDECPSYYNTCQTFNRRDGKTFSFLTNTLTKGECDANSIGCKWYSQSQTGNNWNQDDKIYFNKNIEDCSQNQVGCHEFLQLTNISDNKTITDVYNDVQAQTDDVYENYSAVNKIYLNGKRTSCLVKEVGCELYTPLSRLGEPAVPAITKSTDFCPSECAGYRNYKEAATFFDSGRDPVALITKKGKSCSAQNVGCEEFTNLDKVAQGGEGKEYYSYLRQCQKPDNSCATFYTWVGSDTSGFQLKAYELKSSGGAPQTTDLSGACCDPNLSSDNPDSCVKKIISNPDCKEFYTSIGQIYYRYYSKTITCSDDCHPLRKTYSAQADCGRTGGAWDGQNCVYMALPSQGIACPSNAAGCHEYKGNTGTNYRLLIDDNFEDSTNQNWVGTPSNESIKLGGYSLSVAGATSKPVLLTQNKSYILSFWSKGGSTISAMIQKTGPSLDFGSINSLADDWNYYTLGPVNFSDDVTGDEKVVISGTGNFFLDNIILKEISDSVYLIKNSWTIPSSCDTPYLGAQLNCEEYRDRAGKSNFIKSFSYLCGEDKVGCELLIDSQNSDSPYQEDFSGGVAVLKDQLVYIVNDSKKYCNSDDKGCTAYGLPELDINDQVKSWTTKYLKNDPNNYKGTSPILCESKYQGCEEFTSGQAKEYFKDPKDKVCEFRTNVNVGGVLKAGWFKKGSDESCDLDNNNAPDSGWAGLCKNQYSGCAEYKSLLASNSGQPFDQVSCDSVAVGGIWQDNKCFTGDSYYYLDNNRLEYCNKESWKEACVKFSSIINFSDPSQSKESLLSVRKDRVCSEWLQCMSKYSVWDKNSNRYKDVCTQLGRCNNALQADGNSGECANWVLDTPQKLTETLYKSRDISWKGEDYSGYSLYNFYPLDNLRSRNYSTSDEARWRLTYINFQTKEDEGLIGACGSGDSCPANFVCENGFCVAEKTCRGYPENNSPYAPATDYPEVNKFVDGQGIENQCSYEKVKYTSSETKYYNYQSDNIAQKLCSGGKNEGKRCDNVSLPETPASFCGDDGQCISNKKSQNTFLGWEGYCLEPDLSKRTDLNACLTWWPTDMSSGDSDIYNQYASAGFNPGGLGLGDGPYYCVAKTSMSNEWREYKDEYGKKCAYNCKSAACPFGYKIVDCREKIKLDCAEQEVKWDCEPINGIGCYIKGTYTKVNIPLAYCTNDICSKFVEVVDNTDNKAWTDRLWKDQRNPKYNTPTYNYNSECGVFARLPNNDAGNASKIIIFTNDDNRCADKGDYYLASKSYDSIPNELKNIFAKSYDFYKWDDGAEYRCIGACQLGKNNGKDCANDNNCSGGGNGVCKINVCKGGYYYEGQACDSKNCKIHGVCDTATNPANPRCVGGEKDGQLCLGGDKDCRGGNGFCAPQIGWCAGGVFGGQVCLETPDCKLYGECVGGPSGNKCSGGVNNGQACNDWRNCLGDGVCAGDNKCSAGLFAGKECSNDSDCQVDGVCSGSSEACQGGGYAGESCSDDTQCVADGACKVNSICPYPGGDYCTSLGQVCRLATGEIAGYKPFSNGMSWNDTKSLSNASKAPKIFSVKHDSNTGTYSSGVCGSDKKCIGGFSNGKPCSNDFDCGAGKFTINSQESGNIVGRGGTLSVILQFYAIANENQMPIKYRGVQWVNNDSNTIDGADGLYKNQQVKCLKSCSNDPNKFCTKNSECGSGNTCLPINFGNNPEACSEAYIQFSHVYTCPKINNPNLQNCPIDANGSAQGNGLCCVFNPKVMVKDNWGWCNGGAYVGDQASCPGQEFNGRVIVFPKL